MRLLFPRCPRTIFRIISTRVINSFYSKTFRAHSNIINKSIKRFSPFFTHLDSSCAIPLIVWIIFIMASLNHSYPRLISLSITFPVCYWVSFRFFSRNTTTTSYYFICISPKRFSGNYFFIPAIASTNPCVSFVFTASFSSIRNNGQLPKSHSFKINKVSMIWFVWFVHIRQPNKIKMLYLITNTNRAQPKKQTARSRTPPPAAYAGRR